MEVESWEESLGLRLGDALLQRWFGPVAEYRSPLAGALDPRDVAAVEALFQRHRGLTLPQPLQHRLIRADRIPEP